jgi:TPR repeat protein
MRHTYGVLAVGALALVFGGFYYLRMHSTMEAAPPQAMVDDAMSDVVLDEQQAEQNNLSPQMQHDMANAAEMTAEGSGGPQAESVLVEQLANGGEAGHLHGEEDPPATEILKIRASAEAGDGHAQGMLGEFYHKGLGVERDLRKAFYWFRQGAENGDRESMVYLSRYYKGEFPELGITPDLDMAEHWLEQLAISGDGYAMMMLGAVLYDKVRAGEKDRLQDAAWWYNRGTGGNYDTSYTPPSVLKAEQEKAAKEQAEETQEAAE